MLAIRSGRRGSMTRAGRLSVLAIAVAELPLQLVLYRHYRDVVDGQAVFANVIVLFYGGVAILAVCLIDKIARTRSSFAGGALLFIIAAAIWVATGWWWAFLAWLAVVILLLRGYLRARRR
jgi:hypothetical protein